MPFGVPLNDSDLPCTVTQLFVHPVKSCAAIAVQESLLIETGLEFDRAWMVVDGQGRMLTQRVLPRLVLVRPTLRSEDVVLRAPGMLALHLRLDTVEAPTRAQVWDDVVKAYDMGDLASQWFTDFLALDGAGLSPGRVRLVRFDPEEKRLSSRRWTGEIEAENAFSDGYPLLIASLASLDGLNARLRAGGQAAVTMQRFRPNLVLDGLQAHDEDLLHEVEIATAEGPVVLRLVKPCVRCSIPNVDPETAAESAEPGATLAGYRADPRMAGGITFGMNAVVVRGVECMLRVGQGGRARLRFD